MSNGGFGDVMTKLRGSKTGLVVGLSLTATLSLLLVLFAWYICFAAMAVAIVMYGVPYYFGFKDRKKLAVFGLVLLIVLGLAWGLNMANNINNFGSDMVEKEGLLSGGTVIPTKDLDTKLYTFQVVVLNTSVYKNVTLWVDNSWDADEAVQYDMVFVENVTGGMLYERQLTLEKEGIYAYEFEIWDGEEMQATGAGYGPINAPSDEIMNQAIMSGMFYSFFQIGLLFFMLLFLTWWMDKSKVRMQKQVEEAKKRRAEADAKEGRAEEKFVCSECGAEVPGDASKCPQCGETFDDEPEPKKKADEDMKCPKCNAVIFATDKKCWNCGKELDPKS
ncbi:MAG: zinc ribbon domain-containing protein [Methanomassiliicoccales archaeon]|nr:MAG: zinc ribbon domain-containing protein [Methanomassiliicoccales archaeon]